jgi:hypothetical protein
MPLHWTRTPAEPDRKTHIHIQIHVPALRTFGRRYVAEGQGGRHYAIFRRRGRYGFMIHDGSGRGEIMWRGTLDACKQECETLEAAELRTAAALERV